MSLPKLNEKCSSIAGSRKKIGNELREDSLDNSIKFNRTVGEWNSRTIIVEKKNGSFGFTLQSYGIHYKKEQSIEIITYVDFVEEEGPAAIAGMREGDVIISINGMHVEHAEHATIVAAINNCDMRMRMVLIFEDCVRKVELHLKYINIQRSLKIKMQELEQLNSRERLIFDSNWKTHSLPSQKKKVSTPNIVSGVDSESFDNNLYCRPSSLIENMSGKPPQTNIFMYQYLDPLYGTCLISRTGNFIITIDSPQGNDDHHHCVIKMQEKVNRKTEITQLNCGKHKKLHSHKCTQCMTSYGNQDTISLEAYDLASPCCDPECVPNNRKKISAKKECTKEQKRKIKKQMVKAHKLDNEHSRGKNCSLGHRHNGYCYLTTGSVQDSQCSIESYALANLKSENDSVPSYSTSLSSDTVYWEGDNVRTESHVNQNSQPYIRPKSWDNLTTKAFGGCLHSESSKHPNIPKNGRHHSGRNLASDCYEYQHQHDKHHHRKNRDSQHYTYTRIHSSCVPKKSIENLLMASKYLESSGSETQLKCNCALKGENRQVSSSKSPLKQHSAYNTYHFIYPVHSYKNRESNVSSEITRL